MQDTTIVALGCAPFLLSGLAGVAFGVRALLLARASRSWRKARGKILKSAVTQHSEEAGGSTAQVEYEYYVDGRALRGTRIRFGAQSAGGGMAALAERYASGTAVDVLYDPAKPARSTLEPTVWLFSVVAFILGGLALIGVSGFVLLISRSFAT